MNFVQEFCQKSFFFDKQEAKQPLRLSQLSRIYLAFLRLHSRYDKWCVICRIQTARQYDGEPLLRFSAVRRPHCLGVGELEIRTSFNVEILCYSGSIFSFQIQNTTFHLGSFFHFPIPSICNLHNFRSKKDPTLL